MAPMERRIEDRDLLRQLALRAIRILLVLLFLLAAGTLGYHAIAPGSSWLDGLYMTVITVTTIGYGEVIDLSANPTGRVFTMGLAMGGIGMVTYVISTVTSLAVDPRLRAMWRRRTMQRAIDRISGHLILCGGGAIGRTIARELADTRRAFVMLVPAAAEVPAIEGAAGVLAGDITGDALLDAAGIERAAGVFAVSDDDHTNIVICLSARRLNATARIVACVVDEGNAPKMRKAGADATVSVVSIGGLRMASEMIRPTVVTFLDTMLRSTDPTLRIEEVGLASRHAGIAVRRIMEGGPFPRTLLLAIRRGTDWVYHPAPDHPLRTGDVLVCMTTPEEREHLRAAWGEPA